MTEPVLSSEEYVNKGGIVCPFCTSTNAVQANDIEVNGIHAFQDVICLSSAGGCGNEWTDEFTLTRYSPVE